MSEFVHLISAVAWPLVAVLAIYVFRQPLSKFISEIKSVKGGGFAVEREIQEKLERTVAVQPPSDQLSEGPTKSELDDAREVARIAIGSDLDVARRQARNLGVEYDDTRSSMRAGGERTRARSEERRVGKECRL